MYIKDFEERMKTIEKIVKYLKDGLVTDKQKDIIYDMVNYAKGTVLQKRRFCMYYSLGPNMHEKNTMAKIAHFYECKESTIRNSIVSMRINLAKMPIDKINILKEIINNIENTNL